LEKVKKGVFLLPLRKTGKSRRGGGGRSKKNQSRKISGLTGIEQGKKENKKKAKKICARNHGRNA